MPRWVCPLCSSVKLAPARPRRNDSRRFCLGCSETTGKLVERVCPRRQKLAEVKVERKERAAARVATREEARLASYPGVLEAYFETWCQLGAWCTDGRRRLRHCKLVLREYHNGRASSSGHAYSSHRITITVGWNRADAVATLIHEMAHIAVDPWRWHDKVWRDRFLEAACEIFGLPEIEAVMTSPGTTRAVMECVTLEWRRAHGLGGDVAPVPSKRLAQRVCKYIQAIEHAREGKPLTVYARGDLVGEFEALFIDMYGDASEDQGLGDAEVADRREVARLLKESRHADAGRVYYNLPPRLCLVRTLEEGLDGYQDRGFRKMLDYVRGYLNGLESKENS